jgi:hypothetical protein
LRDLVQVASSQPEDMAIVGDPVIEPDGTRVVRVALRTADLPERVPKGVRFRDVEEFSLHLEATGDRPPPVVLDHHRFLGVAHVMSGVQICLYLDPARDWDPESGIRGVLELLWQWMEDAAADRFRPDEALYHAVGGVAHVSPGTPTVVVRNLADSGRHLDAMYLRRRTEDRLDLIDGPPEPGDQHVPVVRLRRDIPVGAGHDVLADLLTRLEMTQGIQPARPGAWLVPQTRRLFIGSPSRLTLAEYAVTGHPQARGGCALPPVINPWGLREVDTSREVLSPAADLAAAIVASAGRNPAGSHQYAVLTVPHPSGGARHLLCLRICTELADVFRKSASNPDMEVDPYKVVQASGSMTMEWCRVSDERVQVTTRRDNGRPVSALHDRTVHIWGVGGLGSWIAEFVVRAGARRVVLHDVGRVTGGLLVRQNYVEDDIGAPKAASLAARLRSIRDDVNVAVMADLPQTDVVGEMLAADLVIDATISHVAGRFFNELATAPGRRAVFAQVATDARTGTLGVAFVNAPRTDFENETPHPTLADVDNLAGEQVKANATLEPYRVFWERPLPEDEFVPTRGCSLPTFHGSAADLAGVAGALLNLIALHLGQDQCGTHLISLPHSGVVPSHHFIPHLPAEASSAGVA